MHCALGGGGGSLGLVRQQLGGIRRLSHTEKESSKGLVEADSEADEKFNKVVP